MTKRELDLISSKGKGIYNQTYFDEFGNKYIGLANGRITRYQDPSFSASEISNIARNTASKTNTTKTNTTSTTDSSFNFLLMGG